MNDYSDWIGYKLRRMEHCKHRRAMDELAAKDAELVKELADVAKRFVSRNALKGVSNDK